MMWPLKYGLLKVVSFHDITREKKVKTILGREEPGINESWEIIAKNNIVLAAANL